MLGLNSSYNTISTTVDMINGKHIFPLGEGLFASSALPSFVFSAAQKKISYSNHMENFFYPFFSTATACILSCTHFVDKANGSSFSFFPFVVGKLGVCVQFSVSSPEIYFVSREKNSFE